MRGDRECQSQIHAAAVAFDGGVDELFDFGKADDLVKTPDDVFAAHPQDRAIQKDIFATGQFGMKTSSHFEQTAYSAMQLNSSSGWFGDARKYLE